MTQYNSFNVKFSNSQCNKLISTIKHSTEITLKLSSNVIGDSNYKTNFLHRLLAIDRQVSKLRKTFL